MGGGVTVTEPVCEIVVDREMERLSDAVVDSDNVGEVEIDELSDTDCEVEGEKVTDIVDDWLVLIDDESERDSLWLSESDVLRLLVADVERLLENDRERLSEFDILIEIVGDSVTDGVSGGVIV